MHSISVSSDDSSDDGIPGADRDIDMDTGETQDIGTTQYFWACQSPKRHPFRHIPGTRLVIRRNYKHSLGNYYNSLVQACIYADSSAFDRSLLSLPLGQRGRVAALVHRLSMYCQSLPFAAEMQP